MYAHFGTFINVKRRDRSARWDTTLLLTFISQIVELHRVVLNCCFVIVSIPVPLCYRDKTKCIGNGISGYAPADLDFYDIQGIFDT